MSASESLYDGEPCAHAVAFYEAKRVKRLRGQVARGGRRQWNDTFTPEHTPTFTLDSQIDQARREMGEAEWARLNAEWRPTRAFDALRDSASGVDRQLISGETR